MSPATRALLILDTETPPACFYALCGDPLFVIPHLADLVHHSDDLHGVLDVGAYRAYTTAHPGALPETDLSACPPATRPPGPQE